LNSISNPLTPEESDQGAGIKPVSPGDLAAHRSSIHARACKPIATQANTLFHVPLHRPRPVFSRNNPENGLPTEQFSQFTNISRSQQVLFNQIIESCEH
jgi:hypothetical protein